MRLLLVLATPPVWPQHPVPTEAPLAEIERMPLPWPVVHVDAGHALRLSAHAQQRVVHVVAARLEREGLVEVVGPVQLVPAGLRGGVAQLAHALKDIAHFANLPSLAFFLLKLVVPVPLPARLQSDLGATKEVIELILHVGVCCVGHLFQVPPVVVRCIALLDAVARQDARLWPHLVLVVPGVGVHVELVSGSHAWSHRDLLVMLVCAHTSNIPEHTCLHTDISCMYTDTLTNIHPNTNTLIYGHTTYMRADTQTNTQTNTHVHLCG